MYHESVVIDLIDVGERLRQVNEGKVGEIAKSMEMVGLLSPIIVYSPDSETMDLVAGAHRLRAAKTLGWSTIDAYVMDGDGLHAQLAEIDENLIRSELTATEQAEHIQRRKEIWDAMRESSGTTCSTTDKQTSARGREGEGRPQEFAQATKDATGYSKQHTNRATRRARAVCQKARDLIRGTKLDTGAFLDGIVKQDLSDEDQVAFVEQRLQDLADEQARKERAEEQKARKEEAKKQREDARNELVSFLYETLTASEWRYVIDRLDASGGKLTANTLREWEPA